MDEQEIYKQTRPSGWFFAEWVSIIGTFVICFVFLFYQNQVQSARADDLYAKYAETQREINESRKEMKQLHIDFITKEKRQNG
jgi:hypothetical protein